MKFGIKGAAVFAALGIATLGTAPSASAIVPMDESMTTARTAEIISDVMGAHSARVITVRMPDGEQFVIHDWSAGNGSVRRVTHRDFDKDGDLEARIAYRDGRVIEIDDNDFDNFDDVDVDGFARLGEDGDVIWDNEIALRYKETERTDVNAYRSGGNDSNTTSAPIDRTYRMTEGDLNDGDNSVPTTTNDVKVDTDDSPDTSSLDLDGNSNTTSAPIDRTYRMTEGDINEGSISSDLDMDKETEIVSGTTDSDLHMSDVNSYRSSSSSSDTTSAPIDRTYRMTEGDMNEGSLSSDLSMDKETEVVSGSLQSDVQTSDVNSYRSSGGSSDTTSAPIDRTYRMTEGDMNVSSTNLSTKTSVDLEDRSVVGEVADKVEDAGDMTAAGLNEVGDKLEDAKDQSVIVANEVADKTEDAWDQTKRVGNEVADKTEDGWDMTKKGAVEVADKLEDAKDETVKYSKKRGVVSRGLNEVGDKLEDVKDFFTGDDGNDEGDR